MTGSAFQPESHTRRRLAAIRPCFNRKPLTPRALPTAETPRNPSGTQSYGGMMVTVTPLALRLHRVPIRDEIYRIDTLNGYIVMLSAATVKKFGILAPGLFHKFGDTDYGLRGTSAYVPVLILPETIGIYERQLEPDLIQMSLRERWRHVRSHRGRRLRVGGA